MPEPPTKRLKTTKTRKFTTADDVRNALHSQNPEDLVQALTELRTHFTVWPHEGPISTQDARLLLAQSWLDASPAAHDLFSIWETLGANIRQPAPIILIVSILSSLLVILSSHYTFHAAGHPILRTLLTPPCMKKLNSYLGGSHTELLLVTLKLFNSMSAFGGGRERKSLLEVFAWETKSLPKLLNMRRKSKGDDSDPLAKPDIRTLYILFCLSFVEQDTPSQLKTTFLEQHRDAFFSIFRALAQDPFPVIRKVLEVCWTGIWSDPKLKRTLKIGLFSEITVAQLLKIYERASAEDNMPEHAPADVAHHFLLAICTRPGVGICFKDRGWYQRRSELEGPQDDADGRFRDKGGKIYNKILANILKTLKVNEDLRQQELALKIMAACPELVAGYWSAAALTLEPRLSSKWIANISFFGTVLSLPIPTHSFLSENGALYHPTPPPLSAVLENTFPSVNTKTHFSKGLQQPSALVQHCTALALCKCLAKYSRVLAVFRSVEAALEEDEGDGQWAKLRRDLEREARHRVPEFQVVVAFASGQTRAGHPAATAALLAESAQRLLWMYHACLPALAAESRFDVGKLVQNVAGLGRASAAGDADARDAAARLDVVRQLHVLRLLAESDQFVWSGKAASAPKSHLHVLLDAFSACEVPALRGALRDLVVRMLAGSIVFQNNREEPALWISALPVARRPLATAADGEWPEGFTLADEAAAVVSFLDDCVQRCLRAPYRYIEDLRSLQETSNTTHDDLPSPLLMTVLEQLPARMTGPQLPPAHVFALATFLRRLVLRLSGVQRDLGVLHRVAAMISEALRPDALSRDCPLTARAIRRQVDMMCSCLARSDGSPPPADPQASDAPELGALLRLAGDTPTPSSKALCVAAALRVVDGVRLFGTTSRGDLRTSVNIVRRLHPPALGCLADSIDPTQHLLWDGFNVAQDPEIRKRLTFECLFFSSAASDLGDAARRDIMGDIAFMVAPAVADVKRAVRLICHGLHPRATPESSRGLVLLLASICERAARSLSAPDLADVKEELFIRSKPLRGLCTRAGISELVVEGIRALLQATLDPAKGEDRETVSGIAAHWLNALLSSDSRPHRAASPWIPYLAPQDLLHLLHSLANDKETDEYLLEVVIAALESAAKTQSIPDMHAHLKPLAQLRSSLPKSATLESLIATVIDACVPIALSGRPLKYADISTDSLLAQCDAAWSRRFDLGLASLDLKSLLFQEEPWTHATVKIISASLYRSGCHPDAFRAWLASEFSTGRSMNHFLPVLHAYLDASDCEPPGADAAVWISHAGRLLEAMADENTTSTVRADSVACLRLMLARIPNTVPALLAKLKKLIKYLPRDPSITPEALAFGAWLARNFEEAKPAVASLVDYSVQWCIGAFAEALVDPTTSAIVEDLVVLVETARVVTPDLAQTLLSVIIQNRLADVSAVALLSSVLRIVPLKPLIVNRYLQSIIQHPHFFKVTAVGAPSRHPILDALHIIFNLHPANTCQITHVQPLVRVYRGTCSTADRKLLSIFQLFETQRKLSVASLLAQWSAIPEVPSMTVLEAVQSLDATLVLRTCLHFPKWRTLSEQTSFAENSRDAQLYDPVFLVLIFALSMSEKVPDSAFSWIELFRTNIVSFLVRALSVKDPQLREIARSQLAALWAHLETADMQEQPHVVYVMNLLRNTLPPPNTEPSLRLPSYTTLILAHAIRGIFYPSNFIYPLTARFLLQRPALDMTDVPMLYGMLYSSSDDWKKERGWIIRFISDGMMSTADWRVLKRRHTWELLAGLFQSAEHDSFLRNSILEVLANLTCNAQATTSLVLKASLLHWIEMQLLVSTAEANAWIKILENILVISDAEKMEKSTAGEWRVVICRCLALVLKGAGGSGKSAEVLSAAAPLVLRLSVLPGPSPLMLSEVLDCCLEGLKSLEAQLDVPSYRTSLRCSVPRDHSLQSLHRGQDLQVVDDRDPLLRWGRSVEDLWQASMTLVAQPSVWDALTCRLLVWRSLMGEDGSNVGEWARTMALENLRTI